MIVFLEMTTNCTSCILSFAFDSQNNQHNFHAYNMPANDSYVLSNFLDESQHFSTS